MPYNLTNIQQHYHCPWKPFEIQGGDVCESELRGYTSISNGKAEPPFTVASRNEPFDKLDDTIEQYISVPLAYLQISQVGCRNCSFVTRS